MIRPKQQTAVFEISKECPVSVQLLGVIETKHFQKWCIDSSVV